ncbi:hypothetical protein N7447_006922 [Penicillium robsamsonii]|uniref:uncharacterized protein n=1 Tax=Penicillium robsamsonii TaxID=1792511 RepID=UPI002546DF29|nr:uncharacterized protein N7447_006922 [Penicillium robsamsonii]KAJ5824582.1 hypothetical protein N7447_006922 [Penicillium robsamsonii]
MVDVVVVDSGHGGRSMVDDQGGCGQGGQWSWWKVHGGWLRLMWSRLMWSWWTVVMVEGPWWMWSRWTVVMVEGPWWMAKVDVVKVDVVMVDSGHGGRSMVDVVKVDSGHGGRSMVDDQG